MYGHPRDLQIQCFVKASQPGGGPHYLHFTDKEKHVFPAGWLHQRGVLPGGRKRKGLQQRLGGVSGSPAQLFVVSKGCVDRGKVHGGAGKEASITKRWE